MNQYEDRIDRLVHSVLSVNPSPEFEGRIRKRIQNEVAGRYTAFRPMVFGVGLAAGIVMIVFFPGLQQQPERKDNVSVPVRANGSITTASLANNGQLSVTSPVVRKIGPDRESKIAVVAVSETLTNVTASAFKTEPLDRPGLEEFSLGTSVPPVTAMAFAPIHNLPQFEIQPFYLVASNEGAAE